MITIKKYANRRLYDSSQSRYITLQELAEMVRQGQAIKVIDAKSEQDLTRPTLVQIILDLEQEGHQIIAYGSRIEPLLSRYLEKTLSSFARHHALANHALERSLDAISQEQAFALPSEKNGPDNSMIMELKQEIDALKDQLKHIKR